MCPKAAALRVGVIGAGKHGSRYARHIKNDVEGLQLAAISRRSDEGRLLASQLNCRWYVNWRDLIDSSEVDCIVAALPPTLNYPVAHACADAGKPLLLEKPMAVTVDEALAIHECFVRQNLGLTIGQTLRYNSVINALREQLPSVGSLYSFSANQRLEPANLAWLDQPEHAGAGVSFHSAVHVFDAIRYITGQEIVRVMARIRCLHSSCLEDHLVVLVELEGGLLGVVDCSKIGPARSGRFELVGEKGQLHGDQVHHHLEFIQGAQRTALACEGPVSTIVPLLQDWSRFLQGEAENPIPAEVGLAAVRVCAACLRSAAKGGWEDVYQGKQ
ncbi:MAG: Gfo/Idh/MocA family oxidoreductase [Desulfobulbus sp.]|nr:Gfo/Idh/MocA family oxidoreductase [Desulfobulbus sp.]